MFQNLSLQKMRQEYSVLQEIHDNLKAQGVFKFIL